MRCALTLALVLIGSILLCPGSTSAAPVQCDIRTFFLDLGSYDVFAPNDTTVALSNAVQYTCNKNQVAVEVTMGASSGPTAYGPRSMTIPGGLNEPSNGNGSGDLGSDAFAYYLSLGGFTPSCGGGPGVEWGDSSLNNGTTSYFGASARKGLPNAITVYACMPHGQNVYSAVHTDNLLVTISY